MMMRRLLSLTIFCLGVFLGTTPCGAQTVTPFEIYNQNPFIQIFGLPAPEPAFLTPKGRTAVRLRFDLGNHFVAVDDVDEDLYIDGETHRFTLALRYGLLHRTEIGIDVPYLRHSGGFQDDFIQSFHEAIGKYSLRRDRIEHDQILIRYQSAQAEEFRLDDDAEGFGDIRLTFGQFLYNNDNKTVNISLRGSLKLPTGNENKLLGSGSTDLAIYLAGSKLWRRDREWGIYGSVGVLGMTKGEVLADLQRQTVGFGSFVFGWRPWNLLILKGQVDYQSSFYENALDGLKGSGLQGTLGGTLCFTTDTVLDLAVVENLKKSTSPDVVFHIALRTIF